MAEARVIERKRDEASWDITEKGWEWMIMLGRMAMKSTKFVERQAKTAALCRAASRMVTPFCRISAQSFLRVHRAAGGETRPRKIGRRGRLFWLAITDRKITLDVAKTTMFASVDGRRIAAAPPITFGIQHTGFGSLSLLEGFQMGLSIRIVRLVVLAGALASGCCAAHAQGKPPGKDALLYFIWPQNGAKIKGGFWVRFGLRNMGVTHASDDFPNTGHHHLFIDVNEPLDLNAPIPQDRNHLHFGAGQTEAHLDLPPGKHTLQLVLGDAKHYPFKPPLVSNKITITILPSSSPEVSETPAPPNEQPVEAQGPATSAASGTRAPSSQCNVPLCQKFFLSFHASDCTYQPFHGPRRICDR
jgi:hypothetical protein